MGMSASFNQDLAPLPYSLFGHQVPLQRLILLKKPVVAFEETFEETACVLVCIAATVVSSICPCRDANSASSAVGKDDSFSSQELLKVQDLC
jgi:hypothetical protein